MSAALILRSAIAVVRTRAVPSARPAVPFAPKPERQRRSILQPRVGRASGLPWDRIPHRLSTLKELHLFAHPGADTTLCQNRKLRTPSPSRLNLLAC